MGRAFRLVDQLTTEFADNTNPQVCVEVAKGARLRIGTFLDQGRYVEAKDALELAQARSAHWPDEARRTLMEIADVVRLAPTAHLSEDELDRSIPDDATIGALERLGRGEDPAPICFANPHLLTHRAARVLGPLIDQHGGSDTWLLHHGVAVAARVRAQIDAGELSYQLSPSGPIENHIGSVDAYYPIETAERLAKSDMVVRSLSAPYVSALSGLARDLLDRGEWRRAFNTQRIVQVAVERLPESAEATGMRRESGLVYLAASAALLDHVPDTRVLRDAVDIGERRLAEAESGHDPVAAEEILVGLGLLYLRPYSSAMTDPAYYAHSILRWASRIDEVIDDPGVDLMAPEWQMPGPIEALNLAESYLRKALGLADDVREGEILLALLDIEQTRATLQQEVDRPRYARECVEALHALVQCPRYVPHLLLRAFVHEASAGRTISREDLDSILLTPISEIARVIGSQATGELLVAACKLLGGADRERALQLLNEARELIDNLEEKPRLFLARLESFLVMMPPDDLPADIIEAPDLATAKAAVAKAATDLNWSQEELGRTLSVVYGNYLDKTDDDDVARALANTWLEINQVLFGNRRTAFAFAAASNAVDLAAAAALREDRLASMRWTLSGLQQFLQLEANDASLESLLLIERDLSPPDPVISQAVAYGLIELAAPCVSRLGVRGERILARIYRRVARLQLASLDANAFLASVQLAKGLRLADAIEGDRSYDWLTDDAIAPLLATLRTADYSMGVLSEHLDGSDQRLHLDDATLVSAYTSTLDFIPDLGNRELFENAQRTVDSHVQKCLSSDVVGSSIVSLDELAMLLPDDTVLLVCYQGENAEGEPAIVSLLMTQDETTCIDQPYDYSSAPLIVGIGDRVRYLDKMGAATLKVRLGLQDDPGRLEVDASTLDLLTIFPDALWGDGLEKLRDYAARGYRHLCVVPHGALHFLPFHLLHLDGVPIADLFCVTTLPTLALLRRTEGRFDQTRREMSAIGVDFLGANPFGLTELPEAADEARQVAAVFETDPIVGDACTESAVLEALRSSRRVHIATHGEHNVAAPAFQRLFVASDSESDGDLTAYEMLALNLHGVELITLSACETALGRFDQADNLRGIPETLLIRGVSAVVGTLWEVESMTSRDFFVHFYGQLARGASRGEAFWDAQRTVRESHPQYRDWGAFQYVGDWR